MKRPYLSLPIQFSLIILTVLFVGIALYSVGANAQATQQPDEVRHSVNAGFVRVLPDALRSGFLNPPPSARLRCYWWWLNGHVTIETSITTSQR